MNFLQKIPLFIFNLLYPSKIYGKENIPDGSAVFVCNHYSALDCGFIAKAYNKDIYFLAKKELFQKKLIAKLIKSYGGIPINRENPDIKSLFLAVKVLKDGHKLTIFPEGTRNKTGTNKLLPIKGGTVVFAVKAKCPILPIMMSGKTCIFKKIRIIIGKPFTLEEFYDKKLTPELIDKMGQIVYDKMFEQQVLLEDIISNKKHKRKKQ